MRALDVVAKGEERVGAKRHACLLGKPRALLVCREYLGLLGKDALPGAVGQDVVVLVRDVEVNGVVAVGAVDAVNKAQTKHLGVTTQPPGVGLAAGEARAVDAALLAGANANGLAFLHVAHGV